MPLRLLFLLGVAAFGLALFGFGKIVEEPERRPSAGQGRTELAASPAGGAREPLEWKLWDYPDPPPPLAAEPPQTAAAIWSTPAEWAPSD